jgi:predicted Ser/Thr protein kinase
VMGHFGVVDLFGANTLLITFGCHSSVTLHEDAACRCAVVLRDLLDEMPDINYTVSIDTGYNLVGNTGIEGRKARVSMGESVDLVRYLPTLQRAFGVRIMATQQTVAAVDVEAVPVDVVDPGWFSTVAPSRRNNIRVFEIVSDNKPPASIESVMKAFSVMTEKKFLDAAEQFQASIYKAKQVTRLTSLCKGLAMNPSDIMASRKRYSRRLQGWEVFVGEVADAGFLQTPAPQDKNGAQRAKNTEIEDAIQTMKKNQAPVTIEFNDDGLFPTFVEAEDEEEETTDVSAAAPEVIRDSMGMEWKRAKKVLTAVGNGSTAVYLALSPHGLLVVLKVINLKSRQMQDISVEDLVAEVQTLSSIRHNNIVGYISCAVTKNHFSFLMEYVAGGSLKSVIDEFGPAPLRATKRYVHDMLLGLECLHSHGIAHCDIKPHNVLLGQDGSCKLTDFGSAVQSKMASSHVSANQSLAGASYSGGGSTPMSASHTDSVMVRGTAFYMSPEACRGDVCVASDLWSIGITTLEIMTGKLPWKIKKSEAAFIQALGKDDTLSPLIPEDLPDSAKDFLMRCFVRDPDSRGTVQDLLDSPFLM